MTKPIGLERAALFQDLAKGGKRIGLLGGSFNPPHQGHIHISKHALKELSLDYIWWIVSPQNPLKNRRGMEQFTTRVAKANELVASEKRIKVTTIETHFRTRFSFDTIRNLREALPSHQMVWLMGADNLSQISQWHNWRGLINSIPIAVFDRAPYATRALASKAAYVYSQSRLKRGRSHQLSRHKPPAWIYLNIPKHPASSTQIRSQGEYL